MNIPVSYTAMLSNGSQGDKVLEFTVLGQPIPLRRPRVAFTRRVPIVYDSQKKEKGLFSSIVRNQIKNYSCPFYGKEEDVCVAITFRIRRPDAHFTSRKRDRGLRVAAMRARVTGGDLDNLAKFYLDAMNKVAYHDDSQITKLCVSKIWCEDEYSDGSISVAIKKL